ncbi:uncharacterized protein TNCT_430701 [Trichonephila clavata]|uniref:Uncharacterized protein n=1 Tax=Trichonephila clavata TaxID=2740835 RepID=A0A8X6GL28_TRICU|nr:uncharacterized protein TNCT_430701 [Trichonephila clavata]
MFGPVQDLRSFRRNCKKICHLAAREEPKEKIKFLKNTRQSFSNSLMKTSKKVAVIKKRKAKEYPKNLKQTILKSEVICKKSLKNYKIEKSQKEEKPISSVKRTQINYSLCKIDFNFPVKAGHQSKLLDQKSLTDSANSKNKVHQRKSVQYKSISNLSLIEKDLSNGYALRSRISDFVRVTRSNSSFLTPTVYTPFQKKRCSQKHLGKRNPTRISVEPKQQNLVNQEMSSSSASTSGLGRKTRSSSCATQKPLQEKHCSQRHLRRKSIKISVPKQQRLEKLELPFSSPVSKYKQNKKGNEITKVSKSDDDSFLSNTKVRSVLEGEDIKIQQKSHQRKSSRNLFKGKENIERPSRKHSKEISTDDILTTPASRPSTLRNSMKGSTPKLNLKPSKRKLDNLDIEIKVTSKIVPCGKMRKKSKGCKLDLKDSSRSSTSRKSGRKSLSSIKVVQEPVINTLKVDTLTDDSLKKSSRTTNMSNDENSPFYNKRQSGANEMKLKPVKAYQADGSKSNTKTSMSVKNIECKKNSLTYESNAKQNSTQRKTKLTSVRYGSTNKDKTSNKKLRGSSTNSLKTKQIVANFARKKNDGINASVENIQSKDSLSSSSSPKQTRRKRKIKRDENSLSSHKKRRVKSLEIHKTKPLEKLMSTHSTPFIKNVASSSKSRFSKIPDISTPKWPIDSLTTLGTSSVMTPYFRRQKIRSLPVTNRFVKKVVVKKRKVHSYSKEKSTPDALKTKIPSKGTLKHQRMMINVLNEKNVGYEDDIFESNKFGPLKTFQLGDESDNSSVNIATPKFDFILTPALPKKTPRFKDCISPSELMLARKNAEEYLYRRNKKKKTVDEAAISAIKKNRSKRNSFQDVPEKKKLDFEEAMNKLIAVKKNLEQDDEDEEDIYFSDVSD